MKKEIIFGLFVIAVFVSGCAQKQEINSFEECVAAGYPIAESYPRQCMTPDKTFVEELSKEESLRMSCETAGGAWIEEVTECENINESTCTELGGTFDECTSACRNDPEAEICTLQCVPVCYFSIKSKFTLSEAMDMAKESKCVETGNLSETGTYNEYTKTWWIDLKPFDEKPGCNPACVVYEETEDVGINWRCTGLIIPS